MHLFCLAAVGLFLPMVASAGATIDLQFAICESSPEKVLKKLGREDAEEKVSSISYMDTQRPSYIQDGITFRVKDGKKHNESSLKIRFNAKTDVPEAYCEWDRYGLRESYTCEVTGESEDGEAAWSEEQKHFLGRYHGDSRFPALRTFGPYQDRKWKLKHNGYKIGFDSVEAPGIGHIMELSVKVDKSDSDEVYNEIGHWLLKNDVVLCPLQESKTHRLFQSAGILKP
jgi:hypothetical protein